MYERRRVWRDCAYAQARLRLGCYKYQNLTCWLRKSLKPFGTPRLTFYRRVSIAVKPVVFFLQCWPRSNLSITTRSANFGILIKQKTKTTTKNNNNKKTQKTFDFWWLSYLKRPVYYKPHKSNVQTMTTIWRDFTHISK